MSHAGLSRSVVLTACGLTAGWLLVGCGNGNDESPGGGTSPAEMTTTETTTETTSVETTTAETTPPTTTTDGENTIEIPSPNITIPSPEMPEVTQSPVP